MQLDQESTYWVTRFCFQRSLGFIYFIGFLIIVNQFTALCGEKGLLPVQLYLRNITFWSSPSLFWFQSSDRWLAVFGWIGVVLSSFAMSGLSERFGIWSSVLTWLLLWIIYLSFVNVGQTFYGFGWESLLLETGFLAIFLGSSKSNPPEIVIFLLRWILFRLMFGAGLIKLRGDPCWRDLTCMQFHYETQPMPNPLSWYFHQLPTWIHKGSVLFTHFVEIVVPFGYFGPRVLRHSAGILTILFQTILILSGNLSWLNYITIVLCIACFDDSILPTFFTYFKADGPFEVEIPQFIYYGLLGMITLLSIRPTLNLISSQQIMNTSFDSLHLVNTYGAFGSIGRTRYEVILEGSDAPVLTSSTQWKEYQFKGKPGDPHYRPPLVSPYHLRLDWQMWFAAMSPYWHHRWILNLVNKLLQGEPKIIKLLRFNPFHKSPPKWIRAQLYEYRFVSPKDHSGNWWERNFVEEYIPPVELNNPQFREVLKSQDWL